MRFLAAELVRIAEEDDRVVGITAGMPTGTGISTFAERFPERGLRCLSDAGEVQLRYPELVERARRVLAGLRKAGLGPGDRVDPQIA